MGTRSKVGYNERCEKRGPLSGVAFHRALGVHENAEQYNRHERRAAKAKLRHHAKFIRKHQSEKHRTRLEQALVRRLGVTL